MGDRHDIDALLIGALYGELEGADQARLDAHLAAHPGDRAAMDALVETRASLRDRIAALPDFEPAPKLSALLLQEAAKRARPVAAESGGLLGWLRAMLRPIVAHPALATAMTLAVVGGAAGLLYQNGRGQVTEAVATHEASGSGSAAAPIASTEQSVAPTQLARNAAADDGKLKSRPGDDYQVGLLEGQVAQDPAIGMAGSATAPGRAPAPERAAPLKKEAPSAAGKGRGYVAVTTPEPEVKQLEDATVAESFRGGTGGAARSQGAGLSSGDLAPAPPMVDANAPAAAFDQDKANALDAWAKVQHARLAKLVQAGKCIDAGALGSDIAAKAPEYFVAHVENDRAVRQCKQYIDSEKRRRASETVKSRSRNVDDQLAKPALE